MRRVRFIERHGHEGISLVRLLSSLQGIFSHMKCIFLFKKGMLSFRPTSFRPIPFRPAFFWGRKCCYFPAHLSDVPAQTKKIFKNRKIFISDRLVALPVTFLKLLNSILGNADKSEWQTPWRCQLLFSRQIITHSTCRQPIVKMSCVTCNIAFSGRTPQIIKCVECFGHVHRTCLPGKGNFNLV